MTEFVAGWIGGCSGLLLGDDNFSKLNIQLFYLGHPFDTLKVRQQALNQRSIIHTVRECVKKVM